MTSVIVVDDDKDTVKIFSDFLNIKEIDVVGKGYNGLEAFELYKELHPDIVILDMKMPEYDGKFAIDKIKNEDPTAKIIVVTGYTEYNVANLEVSAVFYKPYDIDTIVNKINELSS